MVKAKSSKKGKSSGGKKWSVKTNPRLVKCINPIRMIVDTMRPNEPNPDKPFISLAQGDPTAYPHLQPHPDAVNAVADAAASEKANGYQGSFGSAEAREAIAKSHSLKGFPVAMEDVTVVLGCSEALRHIFATLAYPGCNMLIPRPCFSLYITLAGYYGVDVRFYDLLPDQGWEANMKMLKDQCDENTVAMLVTNPSNPCGTVYSQAHLQELVDAADELKVPIIADEVYEWMTFKGHKFVPIHTLSKSVPVFSIGALSKRWLAPGWRLGWIITHDRNDILKSAGVVDGIQKLCQVSLGAASIIQAAVPTMMKLPKAYFENTVKELEKSANLVSKFCDTIPGLRVATKPQGAMYIMLEVQKGAFKGVKNDVDFAQQLLKEEDVAVLPGKCFEYPDYVRVVAAAPEADILVAFGRIDAFCRRRYTGKHGKPGPQFAAPKAVKAAPKAAPKEDSRKASSSKKKSSAKAAPKKAGPVKAEATKVAAKKIAKKPYGRKSKSAKMANLRKAKAAKAEKAQKLGKKIPSGVDQSSPTSPLHGKSKSAKIANLAKVKAAAKAEKVPAKTQKVQKSSRIAMKHRKISKRKRSAPNKLDL